MNRKGKGPGQRLRTGSVPLAAGSVSVVYWVPGPFPRPTLSSRIGAAGPASEPGAGLSSNLPLIAAMSTTNPWHPCYSRFDVSYIKSQLGQLFAARWSPMAQEVQPVWTSLGCASAAICRFCPMRDAYLSGGRENMRPLPSCRAWFRGMDHPTWRHVILSAPASAADAALPLRR